MRNLAVPFDFETPALRQIGAAVARVNGINLAQGLCLLPVPEVVIEGAERAMRAGNNRYSLAQGIVELREALAARLSQFNRVTCSADSVLLPPVRPERSRSCVRRSCGQGTRSLPLFRFIHTTVIPLNAAGL